MSEYHLSGIIYHSIRFGTYTVPIEAEGWRVQRGYSHFCLPSHAMVTVTHWRPEFSYCGA